MDHISNALPISMNDLKRVKEEIEADFITLVKSLGIIGYPDYSSEKALPHYNMPSFEVTENGWLYVMYATPDEGSAYQWFEFRINGIPILSVGTSHTNRHSVFIPVSAGDTLTAYDNKGPIVSITEIRFIPLKTQ